MKHLHRFVPLVLATQIAGCKNGPSEPLAGLPRELSAVEAQLVAADNRFAFKLFKDLSARKPDQNLFVSPLSVSFALGMTHNGAGGETQTAIQSALEFTGLTVDQVNQSYRSLIDLLKDLDPQVQFQIGNSIWYRNTFTVEQPFVETNRRFFDAQISALDFNSSSAVGTINSWVNDKTSGKIPSIVESPIDPLTMMFLINAIYFKGSWTEKFEPGRTRDAPFTLPNGSRKNVPTMERNGKFDHFSDGSSGLTAVDLRYSRGAYTMTVLLPGASESAEALAARLDNDLWNRVTGGFREMSGELTLPRFKMEWDGKLNEPLTSLGMGVAFDPNRADFTRINRQGDLYVSSVKHKTFVDVNEEGTEAAAATSVEIGAVSAPPSVHIDRPFIFALRERFSGTILFLGKVTDPTVAKVSL